MPLAAGRRSTKKKQVTSKRRQDAETRFQASKVATNKWMEQFDTDRSGTMSRAELRPCMETISGGPVSDEDVEGVFRHADRSHTGELSSFEVTIAVSTWHAALKERQFLRESFEK